MQSGYREVYFPSGTPVASDHGSALGHTEIPGSEFLQGAGVLNFILPSAERGVGIMPSPSLRLTPGVLAAPC